MWYSPLSSFRSTGPRSSRDSAKSRIAVIAMGLRAASDGPAGDVRQGGAHRAEFLGNDRGELFWQASPERVPGPRRACPPSVDRLFGELLTVLARSPRVS